MKNHSFSLPLVFVKYCFLAFLFFQPFFSFAQLGKYEFAGVSTGDKQFDRVTTQPAHATFSAFTRNGLFWAIGNHVFNSRSWEKETSNYDTYIEFKVKAQPGYSLNLTKLDFGSYRTNEGPSHMRVSHNASGNFTTDYYDFLATTSTLVSTTWDFKDINTEVGDSVTFRIYGRGSTDGRGAYRVDDVALYGSTIPQVYINEFNYANSSVTKTGFVEVVAPADFKELSTVTLSLYNQEGKPYKYFTLADFKTLENSVYGDKKIYYLDIPTGLVDGNGGISLSSGNYLNQFISYGGSITGVEGPAKDVTSEDLGVTQSKDDGAYNSIALMPDLNISLTTPTASRGSSSATVWEKGAVDNNTKGYDNTQPYQTLPVELVYFRAKATPEGVRFNWATATEINNKEFVIERSATENLDFKPIGKVEGHGTTLQAQQYEFVDTKAFTGTAYYRLKQIDLDGANTYTKVLAVKSKETVTTPIAFYPNPATESIQLSLGTLDNTNDTQVQIINLQGQVLFTNTYKQLNRNNNLTIPLVNIPAGNYYLVVIKDGKREAKAFLKK